MEFYERSRLSVYEPKPTETPTCVCHGRVFDSEIDLWRHYGGCY